VCINTTGSHFLEVGMYSFLPVDAKGRIPLRYLGHRPGFRPDADRFELPRHVDSARTCLRAAFEFRPQKSRKLVADPPELVESQVGINQVCDQVYDLDTEWNLTYIQRYA